MRKLLAGLAISLIPVLALGADAQLPQPEWAYPEIEPNFPAREAEPGPKTVPGSTRQLTRAQVGGMFGGIEDWFPERHGPMPDIVSKGRRPDSRACAACHLTSGLGHPSTGMAAGMDPEYFAQQIKEFAEGKRNKRSAGMARIAASLTPEEVKAAADYFARQKPRKWVEVKEVTTVPVTWVGQGDMRQVKPGAGDEPLGYRIIEVPANMDRTELRDPYSGYIAYVPPGSIKKGEALVKTGGGGKTMACATCHGPELKGVGTIPAIAGRLPTYLMRQMIDFHNGTRSGQNSVLMQPVVAKLTLTDITEIAAYLSSLSPE
jgi:cytochrome c553